AFCVFLTDAKRGQLRGIEAPLSRYSSRSMPKRGGVILVKHARAVLCMQISTRAPVIGGIECRMKSSPKKRKKLVKLTLILSLIVKTCPELVFERQTVLSIFLFTETTKHWPLCHIIILVLPQPS
ncbi:unnamed protein product, partial [Porites evermanni]